MSGTATTRILASIVVVLSVTAHARAEVGGELAAVGAEAKPTPVRVGTSADYRPLTFEEDGKIRGVESEFAEALSKELGLPFQLVKLPWPELIPALREGKIDVIMSGMSITDERSAAVSFADPYLQVGQMALIRKEDRIRFDDPAAMHAEGMRVGVHAKTTGEQFAREKLKAAEIVSHASIEEAIDALRKGQLDFVVHDAPTIWRVVGRPKHEDPELTGLYQPLTEEYLAWAVRKDAGAFRKRLNQALAGWRASGRLEQILDHWITVRKVTIHVAPR